MSGVVWVLLIPVTVAAGVVSTMAVVQIDRFHRYHVHKGNPPPPITPHTVLRELRSVATVAWWTLWAALSDPLRRPARTTGVPVVCVHGYSQNATNMWGIRQVLERAGRSTLGVSMVHRIAPLDHYADHLERAIDGLRQTEGPRFDVVAHSMGGLVLRVVLDRRPDLRAGIGTVITLGSPHRGTAAVRGMTFLPELRAMARRSPLLSTLPSLGRLLPHATLVTVAGTSDTVVYPNSSSLEPEGQTVLLRDVGHAGLLTDKRALAAVRAALRPSTGQVETISCGEERPERRRRMRRSCAAQSGTSPK
ncbi:MAG: hypothetical protein KTR31_19650 [Myxococcales bacterium]|nr:hypothetical protein [Myxococcales bacterium]